MANERPKTITKTEGFRILDLHKGERHPEDWRLEKAFSYPEIVRSISDLVTTEEVVGKSLKDLFSDIEKLRPNLWNYYGQEEISAYTSDFLFMPKSGTPYLVRGDFNPFKQRNRKRAHKGNILLTPGFEFDCYSVEGDVTQLLLKYSKEDQSKPAEERRVLSFCEFPARPDQYSGKLSLKTMGAIRKNEGIRWLFGKNEKAYEESMGFVRECLRGSKHNEVETHHIFNYDKFKLEREEPSLVPLVMSFSAPKIERVNPYWVQFGVGRTPVIFSSEGFTKGKPIFPLLYLAYKGNHLERGSRANCILAKK